MYLRIYKLGSATKTKKLSFWKKYPTNPPKPHPKKKELTPPPPPPQKKNTYFAGVSWKFRRSSRVPQVLRVSRTLPYSA